jgi:hypothetical protein
MGKRGVSSRKTILPDIRICALFLSCTHAAIILCPHLLLVDLLALVALVRVRVRALAALLVDLLAALLGLARVRVRVLAL